MEATFTSPGTSQLLQRALAVHPERVAFRWDGGELRYRAVAERIGRMQAVFAAAGLRRGARVALLAGNNADAWCAAQAALASGMGASWLFAIASADDQLFQLRDVAADVLIVDARGREARVAQLMERHGQPLRLYTLGPAEIGTDLIAASEAVGHHTMRDSSAPEDTSLIVYTGGTTGRSKGVYHDQVNMADIWRTVLESFEIPVRPQYLASGPISHVTGTLVQPVLMRGGTVRLMDGFSPDRILDVIARDRVSLTLLVPTMVYTLLDHPGLGRADVSSLQTVLYGASPMAPSRLLEALDRIGPVFAQMYGQTEGYPLTYLTRQEHAADSPELFSSCGTATAATQIALLDEAGLEVRVGEVGEICARGAHIRVGYLNQPELTAETMRGGWLHTGDMARRDERGYLWLVDRKKDMIVSGGFNVYPREVEDVLAHDPAVAQAAVIGVPDPRWGEAVTAAIERRPGASISDDELAARLGALVRERKGSLFVPKKFVFVEAMPRTAVGKIDKKVLRQPYWDGQDRSIG